MAGKNHKFKERRNPRGPAPPYGDVKSTTTRRTHSEIEQSDKDDAASVGERPPAKKARVMRDFSPQNSVVKELPSQVAAERTRGLRKQASQSVRENSVLQKRVAALESALKNVKAKKEQAEARVAALEEKDARREAEVTKIFEWAAADINKAEEGKDCADAQVKKLTEEAAANGAKGRPMLQHESEAHLTHETLRARHQEFTEMTKDFSDMNAVVRRLKREEDVPYCPINVKFRKRLGIKPSPLLLSTSIDDARKEYLVRNNDDSSKIPRNDGSIAEDSSEIDHRRSSLDSVNIPRVPAPIVDTPTPTTASGVDADEQENGNGDDEGSAETVPSGEKKKEKKKRKQGLKKRGPRAGKSES